MIKPTSLIALLAGFLTLTAAGADLVPGSLVYHLATNAVGHAAGYADPSRSNGEVSHWNYARFSSTNMGDLTNAVWSDHFWLQGVQGLSATTIGMSNNLAGQGLYTMVSPRHYLCATHMHGERLWAAFLDTNNVIHWRTTIQRVDLGNDISVGLLNADLPPAVGYLPVLPANFMKYIPLDGTIVQGIGMNQNLCLFGQPMKFFFQGVAWSPRATAPAGLATNWNVAIRGGDSSDPEMLLIGRQLVLVSHNYSVGQGPNYAAQYDAINQAMHTLSTNNQAGSDYQLTPISLTDWPPIN